MAPRNTNKTAKKKAENAESTIATPQADGGQASPLPCQDDAMVSTAGQSSVTHSELSLDKFNDNLQKRIVEALCTTEVIDVITKALSDVILESVTQRVYESIDHDLSAKLSTINGLEKKNR